MRTSLRVPCSLHISMIPLPMYMLTLLLFTLFGIFWCCCTCTYHAHIVLLTYISSIFVVTLVFLTCACSIPCSLHVLGFWWSLSSARTLACRHCSISFTCMLAALVSPLSHTISLSDSPRETTFSSHYTSLVLLTYLFSSLTPLLAISLNWFLMFSHHRCISHCYPHSVTAMSCGSYPLLSVRGSLVTVVLVWQLYSHSLSPYDTPLLLYIYILQPRVYHVCHLSVNSHCDCFWDLWCSSTSLCFSARGILATVTLTLSRSTVPSFLYIHVSQPQVYYTC